MPLPIDMDFFDIALKKKHKKYTMAVGVFSLGKIDIMAVI
jgi:hypothetical protein